MHRQQTYLTGIGLFFTIWTGAYHALGDSRIKVVIFVALHSVDHSHSSRHQDIWSALCTFVSFSPSSHQTFGLSCWFFHSVTQPERVHRLGYLRWCFKLKIQDKNIYFPAKSNLKSKYWVLTNSSKYVFHLQLLFVASLLHLSGNSLLVPVMSPYLEQHEVIELIFSIKAGMRKVLDLDDLPGLFFLVSDGVYPQIHMLNAAETENRGFKLSFSC